MADLFEEVIAVDKNRPRVDFARWLIDWSGNSRITANYGDITDLDQPSASADFVFCYGVVISYLSLRSVLREFKRVAKPGGVIYVCVNGPGWSFYLRDERGAQSSSSELMGKRGIYNTYCRTQQATLNDRLSRLMAVLSREGAQVDEIAGAAGMRGSDLIAFLSSFEKSKTLDGLQLPGGWFRQKTVTVSKLAELLDKLLATANLGETPIASTLANVERECGREFVDQFGVDLINLVTGKRDSFSHATAGRGYLPEEVEGICKEVGLADFRWSGDGSLLGYHGEDVTAPSFFISDVKGKLGVWEFVVRKP